MASRCPGGGGHLGGRWSSPWEARGDDVKAVYALTNEPTGNQLAVFARDGRGMLSTGRSGAHGRRGFGAEYP